MHRVIAGDRHAAQDRLGLAGGRRLAVLQRVADDLVVELGVQPILVQPDAGAAMRALGEGRAEAHIDVGMTCALGVLERDQKSAVMRLVFAEIDAAPGVHVDRAIGRHGKLAGMTDLVGEDGGAESLG